ncbi:unnamed protein product [Taenia asiatica]|uniref:SCP domain-containing protein n=1 Tax=Taenia asiatica TaxID=60517 RepID=A0A0R3VYR0_TAEAS|nr:unnamed protein product [Taenia asiatica]
MANKWWNESYDFNYEKNVCEAPMCGYYLQMVWGNTEKIGCAVQRCEKVQRGPQTPCYLLTCAYTPPIINVIPYAKGESCSACPNGTTSCKQINEQMRVSIPVSTYTP